MRNPNCITRGDPWIAVKSEKFEVGVLQAYMPQALSDAEVEEVVSEAISLSGAKGQQDMGRVMAQLKPRLSGRADMGKVSLLVRTKLLG